MEPDPKLIELGQVYDPAGIARLFPAPAAIPDLLAARWPGVIFELPPADPAPDPAPDPDPFVIRAAE